MALRRFDRLSYLPYMALKPSEMRALETLPNATKDALLPIIQLKSWLGANLLQKGLDRIEDAYGSRPVGVTLAGVEPIETRRPVHDELDALRSPRDGFANWCNFIDEHPNFIPTVQFGPAEDEISQLRRLHGYERGLFVIIEHQAFRFLSLIAERVSLYTERGRDVCFVLDYGRAKRDLLQAAADARVMVDAILRIAPLAYVSISASSFPESFDNLPEQEIYERRLFETVRPHVPRDRLIYSDRGSARAESSTGGSGRPPPRIDYPLPLNWKFYRSATAGAAGYQEQARALMRTPGIWDSSFRVWGTQMIERTALNDAAAITNPQRATAARISIHLQRQTFYDNPAAASDTDEDWDG